MAYLDELLYTLLLLDDLVLPKLFELSGTLHRLFSRARGRSICLIDSRLLSHIGLLLSVLLVLFLPLLTLLHVLDHPFYDSRSLIDSAWGCERLRLEPLYVVSY